MPIALAQLSYSQVSAMSRLLCFVLDEIDRICGDGDSKPIDVGMLRRFHAVGEPTNPSREEIEFIYDTNDMPWIEIPICDFTPRIDIEASTGRRIYVGYTTLEMEMLALEEIEDSTPIEDYLMSVLDALGEEPTELDNFQDEFETCDDAEVDFEDVVEIEHEDYDLWPITTAAA